MRKPTIRPMRRNRGLRIICIPDTQVKPDVPLCHLEWAGKHIANRKPDVVVHLGDFTDMGSCSTHDEPGSLAAEGRSISADLAVARKALKILGGAMRPWRGRKVLTLGNHENRLARYVEAHPEHRHTYAKDPFGYEAAGWEVHPFLKPVIIAGVAFSHYFPRSASGAIMQTKNGAPNALTMVKREMRSCVAGHRQGLDTACYSLGDRMLRGVIAGSCLTPDHKVLTADLRYVELGSIKPGDRVVSFDEMAESRKRRFRTGVVTHTKIERDDVYAVYLSDGRTMKVTGDHLWLCKTGSTYNWRRTDRLQSLRGNRRGTKVPQLLPEWSTATEYEAGWLSGMYDGEGCLYHRPTSGGSCMQLTLAQKPGPVMDRAVGAMRSVFDAGVEISVIPGKSASSLYIVGGRAEMARVLGTLRPTRLITKFSPEMLGSIHVEQQRNVEVVDVRPIGKQDVARIAIDKKTMIVEGFGHHNCYLHDEDYLSEQGRHYWAGILELNEAHNGYFDLVEVSIDYLCRRWGGGKWPK